MQTNHTSRRTFIGLMGAAIICPETVRAGSFETMTGHAFGTTWSMTAPPGNGISRLRPAIETLFESIDKEMSPWRSDSAISLFNSDPLGAVASPNLVHLTRAACMLAEESGGAFDPTVGPLVARWGFGPIKTGSAPNWRGLSIGPDALTKAQEDLTLDLCGIAKGWALDRATSLAREAGIESLLFDLGGELTAIGLHPSGRRWRVAVENPGLGPRAPAVLYLPDGMAVATSGLQAQSYGLGGRTWGHIIDPKAESPVQGALRAVTVLANDAMTADGWATALFAAGDTMGPALARRRGIKALFLFTSETTLPRTLSTGGIGAMFV